MDQQPEQSLVPQSEPPRQEERPDTETRPVVDLQPEQTTQPAPTIVRQSKDKLLESLRAGLADGTVSDADVMALMVVPSPQGGLVQGSSATTPDKSAPKKLSPVEVMFYVAGIVLFAAIMSLIAQIWDQNNAVELIGLSAGVGYALWMVAYVLHWQQSKNDIRQGMESALIVTGILCVIVGGFIIMTEIIGRDSSAAPYFPVALTLIVLSAIFFAYDRLIRNDLVILLGVMLGVAAFPTLISGLLSSIHLPPDVWSLISLASIVLLLMASRVVARLHPDRPTLHRPFDGLCSFLALGTMFISSFTDYGLIWLILLFMSVFGMFYLSIIHRNKQFLGTASFYLIAGVLTVAFKYFTGGGVTMSLIVAAIGLLGSAGVAASINRKYFKTPS